MPSKKRSILPYYIFINMIVVGFLLVSFFNINKKEKPEDRHYEVINLAQLQIEKIHSISDGLLTILAFDEEHKVKALYMNDQLVQSWEGSQLELKDLIDRSKIKEADKQEVYRMYETCLTFMNNFKTAQAYVVQKASVSSLANSFNTLVKKNEDGYIKKMNELIDVYQNAEDSKRSSQNLMNYLVMGIGIIFVFANIFLLFTPSKKIIFGEKS